MTIIDKVLMKNSTLFVDKCGVPQLLSEDKITLVSNMLSEQIPIY